MIITADKLSKQIIEGFGLPKRTRAFVLRVVAGEAVTIDCEYYADERVVGALTLLSRVYTLQTRQRILDNLDGVISEARARIFQRIEMVNA